MVKIIKNSDIDNNTLKEIIAIKSLSWDYSAKEHLDWINQNLQQDDLHFLLYNTHELIGYLNLVKVSVINNNIIIPFIGIGNVCTKYKGKGDGTILMEETNRFLIKEELKGLLFCKNNLIDFYKKTGWEKIKNIHPNNDVYTMHYNNKISPNNFTYNDRLF